MILKNKMGLKGQETKPVALVRSFLNSIFDIEKSYGCKETYTIIENGKPKEHLLHHVTNADLQLATILLKFSNTKGEIYQTKPHSIYSMLIEYYEKPISLSQFYSSMKKFKLHAIIEEIKNEHTGLYNYKLNHFLNTEKNKIDFYVPLSPIVFTKAFYELSLPKKKLFYSVYLQQGGEKGKEIQRNLYSNKDSVQFSGLCNFLHRKDPYLIRKLLEEMSEPVYNGIPIFEKAKLVKEGKAYHKAIISIHPDLLVQKSEDTEYNDRIPVPVVYRRKANFIKKLLEGWGISEFVSLHDGYDFANLVRILKNYGYKVIRYAVYQLKKFVDDHVRFPGNVVEFILKEVRNKTQAVIVDIAVKTKVADYINPELNKTKRKYREWEFSSNLSYYGVKAIESSCKAALPLLKEKFGKPAKAHLKVNDYTFDIRLNDKDIYGFELVRQTAHRYLKDLRTYSELEYEAAERYIEQKNRGGFKQKTFIKEMLEQVHKLPSIEIVPVIPEDFKLEDFLVQNFIAKTQ
ncbi:hypothetical protein [Chengkuizengella axinellae]|uniref:Uncharacterized protein n=1 Tax=Chengkuizengella axinellae TaxID=3064388 RepID=A0ABT9J565_9BACL|nr:hypothetical protein [Chengkuizengella sp. 2205SS18-9]MDP5276089.1 hypothetical protein [Chengkuizengella sp. 2205SS18-9]